MGEELTVHIKWKAVDWEYVNTPTFFPMFVQKTTFLLIASIAKLCFFIPLLRFNQDSTVTASKAQAISFLVTFTSKGSHSYLLLPLITR